MPLTYTIQPELIQTEILFGSDLIPEALEYIQASGNQSIILTTPTLAPALSTLPNLVTLSDGESIKNRATREKIEDLFYERGVNRQTTLVAIGGGALLDFAGMMAATWMRGIDLITFPTTLLAMTDASLGGKNGINFREGKNWIGTFYHPKRVYMDFNFLKTLPQSEWISGLAETVKHAAIYDAQLFAFLESHEVVAQEEFKQMIEASVAVKLAIVTQDPFEKSGLRHILNFGHTVGHAIEVFNAYRVSHGRAVALGMVVEAAMAVSLGLLGNEDYERLLNLCRPMILNSEMPPFALTLRDKKNGKFVGLRKIGGPCELIDLTESLYIEGWNHALRDIQRADVRRSYYSSQTG